MHVIAGCVVSVKGRKMSKPTSDKFPIGTRVRVYATLNGAVAETKGSVTRIRTTDGMLYVNLDGRRGEIVAHPMQCRKLVKKERRRIWLMKSHIEMRAYWTLTLPEKPDDYIEFVEARRKK